MRSRILGSCSPLASLAVAFCGFSLTAQTTYTAAQIGSASTVHPRAMNNQGQVVGYMDVVVQGFSVTHAFLYSNGTITDLGTLGGKNSQATAINNSGIVVGWSETGSTATPIPGSINAYTISHAFRYSAGQMTDMGSMAGADASSNALLINDSGAISGLSDTTQVCDYDSSNNPIYCATAYVYSNGQMSGVGSAASYPLNPVGINHGGQIVAWQGYNRSTCALSFAPHEHAFDRESHARVDLDEPLGHHLRNGARRHATQRIGKRSRNIRLHSARRHGPGRRFKPDALDDFYTGIGGKLHRGRRERPDQCEGGIELRFARTDSDYEAAGSRLRDESNRAHAERIQQRRHNGDERPNHEREAEHHCGNIPAPGARRNQPRRFRLGQCSIPEQRLIGGSQCGAHAWRVV